MGRYGTELHELRGGLCRAHMEEEVYRDFEGPSTYVSLKQNSSSGVGTDVEGKQSWRKWPGPSNLTFGEHGARCVVNTVENRKRCNPVASTGGASRELKTSEWGQACCRRTGSLA